MPTDQNNLAASYYIQAPLEQSTWSKAYGALIGICELTSPGKFLSRIRIFAVSHLQYHVTTFVVNRDGYVVLDHRSCVIAGTFGFVGLKNISRTNYLETQV
jgi:hypothetical protein